jgi:3-oxoacyl-[acyl-carrier-protein] synthase III
VADWHSTGRISVLGTGSALPGEAVANEALIARMATLFGLTREREARLLGERLEIAHRHLARSFEQRREAARPEHTNSALAAAAIDRALTDAGLDIDDLGYLIGHTATPDLVLPSNIALVADRLGYEGPHVELRQACTGFANALMIAFGLLADPDARPVAIVGSETGSLLFDPCAAEDDPEQRVNMMQMGDGAAAVILHRSQSGVDAIEAAWFGSIGLGRAPGLRIESSIPGDNRHDFAGILANGYQLFEAGVAAAARSGAKIDDVDRIVPHQVSGRIGAQVAAHFGFDPARSFVNANRVGNTGSAAMWLALDDLRHGELPSGRKALFLGAEATKYMHGGFVLERA